MIWVEPYDIEPGNQRDVLYIKGKGAIEFSDYYNKNIIEDLLFNREER